ncbi:MAG: hypothetical protein OXF32_03550 [Anaerolineaceae bacterium]|nr:hypothetical protein [Anaerolineaceae bacterium]
MTRRSERSGRLQRTLVPAYFGLLAVIVFATQFAGTGFGNKAHYSWASSHTLAIVSRATPANGFVGHSRTVMDAGGRLDYRYFDRSPFLFGALTGTLINLTDNLTLKVWIARQVMHVIFILTMLLAWRLLRRLGARPVPALVMVTLAFSGYQLIFYRELIDYSQPAFLASLLLLYVIARVKLERRERWRWLTIATLVAVSFGRVPVSLSVLGLWALVETAGILLRHDLTLAKRLRAIMAHDATRMVLLGGVWVLIMISYNFMQEMSRREVALEQTTLFDAMQRRLPGGGSASGWTEGYDAFSSITGRRLLRWYLPLDEVSGREAPQWLLLPVLVLILLYCGRQKPARRITLLLTAFSGLVWLFAMINVTAFHDFMTIQALGLALVFWLATLEHVRQPRIVAVLLALSLALFLRNHLEAEANNSENFRNTAIYTEEYDRILRQIGRSGQVVHSSRDWQDAVINRSPVILGFYLGDNILAESVEQADYLVAAHEILALPADQFDDGAEGWRLYRTLTPENRVAFLFDTTYVERHPPEDMVPTYNFGAEVALGRWHLQDSVQLRPCQRVNVESWWQALAPLQANYRLQLSLTDAEGLFLVSSDSGPSNGATQDWLPGNWYPDGRLLKVPCDAPAGEYPLILSVYDPASSAANDKLPLVNADGSAGDTWLYLTTLFVN